MTKKTKIVDGMKYIVTTCRVCGEEIASHPILYKAKVDKNICMDCFVFGKKNEAKDE